MVRTALVAFVLLVGCEKSESVAPELRIGGPFPGDLPLQVQPSQLEARRGKELSTAPADQPLMFHAIHRGMYQHTWGVRVVDAAGTVCRDTTETIRDDASRTNPRGYGGTSQFLLRGPDGPRPCMPDTRSVPGHYTATFTLDGKTVATRTFDITP